MGSAPIKALCNIDAMPEFIKLVLEPPVLVDRVAKAAVAAATLDEEPEQTLVCEGTYEINILSSK